MRKTLVAIMLMALTTLGLTASPAQAGHPGTASNKELIGYAFAGASVQFDLVTHGNDQYAAFFNQYRNLTVKHRTLDANGNGSAWTEKVIQRSSYSDTDSQSFKDNWDVHNWLRLGVDGSGNVHVVGDMHNTAIRYWRTSTPGDLSTLSDQTTQLFGTMNTLDKNITYPEFIDGPGGNLRYLMLRKGRSGNGDTQVLEWTNSSKTWHEPGSTGLFGKVVFDNTSSYFGDGHGSVYSEVFYTPHNKTYHIVYNWREDGCVWSNSKMSYVRTTDFVTFQNEEGLNVPTPITADMPRPVIDTVPVSKGTSTTTQCPNHTWKPGGIINSEYQFLVAGDHVVVGYTKNDPSGQRQFYAAHQGAPNQSWGIHQITSTGASGVGNMFPENYGVVLDTSGNVALDHNYNHQQARFTKRTAFNLGNIANGPFPTANAPSLYWPSGVTQTCDSFPGCTSRVEADSRSHVNAPVQNRQIINSEPNGNLAYVISWLAGPEIFNVPETQEPSYPARPIYIHKVTY